MAPIATSENSMKINANMDNKSNDENDKSYQSKYYNVSMHCKMTQKY